LYIHDVDKVKQVFYSGEINRGRHAVAGHFPDTALVGYSELGGFGFFRYFGFHRIKYSKDTLAKCFCLTYTIPLNNVYKNINLLEDPEPAGTWNIECLELIHRGQDTVFNGILSVKRFNKYLYYTCHDDNFYGGYSEIVIDLERNMLVQFFRKNSNHNISGYNYKFKIVSVKEITEQYFYELWNKAEDYPDKLTNLFWDRAEDYIILNCSPW